MMLSQWEATRPTSDFPSKTIHDGPLDHGRDGEDDDGVGGEDHGRDGEDDDGVGDDGEDCQVDGELRSLEDHS